MSKINAEGVRFAMAFVRQLRRHHQIPAVARIFDCHESTVRYHLKKKKPKKQYKRRAPKVVGVQIAVALSDEEIAAGVPLPEFDDDVMKALREHMGAELDGVTT